MERPSVRRPLLAEEFIGGPVSATCINHCHESRIVAALAAVPDEARDGGASRKVAA